MLILPFCPRKGDRPQLGYEANSKLDQGRQKFVRSEVHNNPTTTLEPFLRFTYPEGHPGSANPLQVNAVEMRRCFLRLSEGEFRISFLGNSCVTGPVIMTLLCVTARHVQFNCDRQKVIRIFFTTRQEIGESADEENIRQETERDGPQSRESTVVEEGQE